MDNEMTNKVLGSSVKSFSRQEMQNLFETSDSDVRFTPIFRAGKTVKESGKMCAGGGVSAISGLASYSGNCLG